MAFVHWPFEPHIIAPLVPPPLKLDTFEGSAWVTLTPFSTTCEVLGHVKLPGEYRFPETNLRTYVRGPDGHTGLLFLSLDVTNRANTVLGRAMGLPYVLSDMEVDAGIDWHYAGRRRHDPATGYDVVLTPTDEPAHSSLDVFLTGRWSAYVVRGSLVFRHDVVHEPWPLYRAFLHRTEESLLSAAGISRPTSPPVVHVAAGVSARLGPPVLIFSGSRPSNCRS